VCILQVLFYILLLTIHSEVVVMEATKLKLHRASTSYDSPNHDSIISDSGNLCYRLAVNESRDSGSTCYSTNNIGHRLYQKGQESRRRRDKMVEEAEKAFSSNMQLDLATRAVSTSSIPSSSTDSMPRYERLYGIAKKKDERRRNASGLQEQRNEQSVSRSSLGSREGVHNRLYAMSEAQQRAGKEKRQQIAKSLAPKLGPKVKITPEEASSLFDRLYENGVQKQISLGRKKYIPEFEDEDEEGEELPEAQITSVEADQLYNRLYRSAILKQVKDMKAENTHTPKMKVITSREADSLYERLYEESTLSIHRSRIAKE